MVSLVRIVSLVRMVSLCQNGKVHLSLNVNSSAHNGGYLVNGGNAMAAI